ncbi:MAG: CBS domain-containing protein [Sphingobacteriia bacterium]|nr:CBS domain-containing protein [Sphingobacteriia bacterium]
MKKEDISYTIVMDEEKYLGIFGEKEYSQSVVLNGNHADEMLVKELLGTVYPAIDASDTTDNCIKLMSCYKLRYLPVFDGFDFIGIVTENDLLDEVAKEKTVK